MRVCTIFACEANLCKLFLEQSCIHSCEGFFSKINPDGLSTGIYKFVTLQNPLIPLGINFLFKIIEFLYNYKLALFFYPILP